MTDEQRGRFRPGDVLRLECPFTPTTVTGTSRYHVTVRWPWKQVDPEAENIRWNGDAALPTPESHEWERLYYRTDPPVDGLAAGDRCRVGIAPTVVHLVAVHDFDPPLVTGMLPRPARYLELLPQGETHDPDFEDQAFTVDPAGAEPIRLELLFRPYAFLDPGDELTDRDGRAWRFDAPWEWQPLDGGRPGAPSWPLALRSRRADGPTADGASAVARATAVGSHAGELARWTELTRAKPVPYQG